jgi:TRAP-type mannitol/chloroaromatic compound transport system substrate-binding protein
LRSYSEEILNQAEQAAFQLYDEFAAKDADFKKIYEGWKQFRDRIYTWNDLNESNFTRFTYSKLVKS